MVTEWQTADGQKELRDVHADKGGSMRLGAQQCHLVPGSLAAQVYGQETILERHRHRYEINQTYMAQLTQHGMLVSGTSVDGALVEMIELPDHPWFLACQFHPEFSSSPRDGHPLFLSFVMAARVHHHAAILKA